MSQALVFKKNNSLQLFRPFRDYLVDLTMGLEFHRSMIIGDGKDLLDHWVHS